MKPLIKNCIHCGDPFVVTRKDKGYCCDSCRVAAWKMRQRFAKTLPLSPAYIHPDLM